MAGLAVRVPRVNVLRLFGATSGSNHSVCASTKSMPCFALFAADFAASNSNRIWYRKHTVTV